MFNGGMLQLILETAPIEAEYITNVSNRVIGVQSFNHLSFLRPIQLSKVEAFFWMSNAKLNRDLYRTHYPFV